MLALRRPRPISVAPDQQDRNLDTPVVLGRGLPGLGIAEQAEEGAVVAGSISHQIHFLQERRRDVARIGNPAIQDRAHDEEVPQAHHGLADHRQERCVGDDPAEQGAPRHAAALGVVVRVDGDDAEDARIAPGGDDQSDRSADRDAGKRDVTQIEPVEKAFDSLREEGRVVAGLGNVRIAVPRIIQRVDGKVPGELRYDFFEQVQLRSQRMQKHEVWTFAGLEVAERIAANIDVLDGKVRSPAQSLRLSRRRPQRLHDKREQPHADADADKDQKSR